MRSVEAFVLPNPRLLYRSPVNHIIVLGSHVHVSAPSQYFTRITRLHSFNKNSLDTDHVQDTSLDIRCEQITRLSCFRGSDTNATADK